MSWMSVEVRPAQPPVRARVGRASLWVPAAGCQMVAYPSGTARGGGLVVDEHFAVDADRCRQDRWLGCADVLYSCRVRSPAEVGAWLAGITAAFGSCRLAATAMGSGRWAVQSGAGRPPMCIGAQSDDAAVVSCLHGWMVAGGSLDQLGPVGRPVPERDGARFTAEVDHPPAGRWPG